MTPRLLVLQLSRSDPPGRLGEWLTSAGAELELVQAGEGGLPAGLDAYQGVVCLGGEMGAYDDAEHPWLAGVRMLLGRAVAGAVPVLAVCLGAQLLAVATGGQVRRGPHGAEIGPMLVAKRDAALRDPLFALLPLTPDVLQFHDDEVHVLPPRAELLAASPRYPHQAFRVGPSAYGLQFHIETTPELVTGWAREAFGPDADLPQALSPQRLAEAHADIAETWQPFAERFVELAAGKLEPPTGRRRDLPLV
ncbi:type 1 glutamine amidotransferase [Gandjariella thermophila]|uniref:Glutamine amidotransferase n=1 Tax=Gandjariella thermophila TaxID=1931992 RepID=A0A4D4JG40_9PSEU|nr:type 1 glutamine amidotransferase [Gandjariella thermophila]GDY33618.1 glutamine amidotransferase [Gandjariella thermophila]